MAALFCFNVFGHNGLRLGIVGGLMISGSSWRGGGCQVFGAEGAQVTACCHHNSGQAGRITAGTQARNGLPQPAERAACNR
jgi:hypothetical protein